MSEPAVMTHEIANSRHHTMGGEGEAGKIFLCYRRDDSAGHAGRVYDRLSQRFPGRVFMDVAGIGVGTRWAEVIGQTLGSCDVFVILIGRRWLERDSAGLRRIDDPEDPLRAEITTALRLKLRIIPLLVSGAAVPPQDKLPKDVAPIADWQAFKIDDEDFDHYALRLIEALEGGGPGPAPSPPSKRRAVHWAIVSIMVILMALAAWGLRKPADVAPAPVVPPVTPPPPTNTTPVEQDSSQQMAGEYKLTSYTLQDKVYPVSGSMRLRSISAGRFGFEMYLNNSALGKYHYKGLFERQGTYWTMTTTNDPTIPKVPFPAQVSFDGSTLKLQNPYYSAATVWRKH
jgi:hypothetical protein